MVEHGLIEERKNGEEIICRYLSNKKNDEECALCLIDIDDFRELNDTYGYSYGDEVLSEISEILVCESSFQDIIVRFGSDEFILFITNSSRKKTTETANRIFEKIHNISSNKEIGCSIAIAGTENTDEFLELYQCADSTLNHIKKYGKDCIAWHVNLPKKLDKILKNNEFQNESIETIVDLCTATGDDIISFAFKILERTKDLKRAIMILLERIGREFNLKSILIDEINEDNLTISATYSWNKRFKSKNDHKISYIKLKEGLEEFKSFFCEDGYFDMNKINIDDIIPENREYYIKAQKSSRFYNSIYDEGVFSGVIIYEHVINNYVWDEDDKNKLKELSKIISIHITKINADSASRAKTEFLSRMSHDIRTPMNAIIGMTAIAKNVLDDKEKSRDCLDKIERSTKYLLSLVNDILDMSKIESGKMVLTNEKFKIDDIISEFENFFSTQASDRKIVFEVRKNVINNNLIGDATKLNQIIINLIGNSLKFTSEYGKVIFEITQMVQENELAIIKFTVKDTGIGISKKKLSKIFNAFEQADNNIANEYGGSGLGLAISSNLVKLMGGVLEVNSTEGQGSEFYFTVSFKIDNSPEEEKNEHKEYDNNPYQNYDFSGKRVLLVEDNELNAEIAQTVLEMVGFKTELTENGKKAVFKFAEMEVNHYDLILMDIRMPVMDGLEATKYIRNMGKKDSKTIPILAMTANAFDDDMEKSIANGMNGHLSKPIDVKKLYYELNKLV